MKAHGFSGVFRLSILIGFAAFHFASAATPSEQNVQTTRSQQGRQVNQSNKTKNKQTTTNANSALKAKQSKSSQPVESNAQRNDADSRRKVESPGSEYHQEKAALIGTGIGAVLRAIHKPAPSPPAPPPVVAKTTPAEQKTTPHKRTRPKSSDDDVWSRINPVSK
jgi:hypothetical protein